MKAQLLIPAAGMGTRLGPPRPKALLDLAGEALIVRTLARFRDTPLAKQTVIVIVPPDAQAEFAALLAHAVPDMSFAFAKGGAERQWSVANGLDALDTDTEIVAIHDAARPFVTHEAILASLDAAAAWGAATVAIPSADTILVADPDQFLLETPDRARLWACQTPQTFRVDVIREAHQRGAAEDFVGTDDASLVRRLGRPVKLVMGSPLNFKITTPEDRALAESLVERGVLGCV